MTWQHSMTHILLAIRSVPPGYLSTRKESPLQLNPATQTIQPHLLAATLQSPAAKETPPRGHPITQVGHHPHSSMELPHLGIDTEDPTALTLGLPPGPANTSPEHSGPGGNEQQESSSTEPHDKVQFTQWGTGKFSPSRGKYTVPPPEPWDPYPHRTLTPDIDQEIEEAPMYLHRECSLCAAPIATFHPFRPLTCSNCKDILQDNSDTPIRRETHEKKGDEEKFLFKGIPIAGENA